MLRMWLQLRMLMASGGNEVMQPSRCLQKWLHDEEKSGLHLQQSAANTGKGRFDVCGFDAVVGDGADSAFTDAAHEDAVLAGKVQEARDACVVERLLVGVENREDEHIGNDALRVDLDLWEVGEAASESFAGLVIFGQAVDHLLQGNDSCCRQDACLAHAAAEDFAHAMGAANKFSAAHNDRADGRAQAL